MIQSLYIKNFAIIETLSINFEPGMSVLTGETGAGKSIIIDALGQLIGDRTQISFIKDGCQDAMIEGVFNIKNTPALVASFESFGIPFEETLVVSKHFFKDGKTTFRLNYRIVTQSLIKQIMPMLVDIHSQYDNQLLLVPKMHQSMLDQFADTANQTIYLAYQQDYQAYKSSQLLYEALLQETIDETQLDYLNYQLQEIAEANIKEGEYEALEQEARRIKDYEKISERTAAVQYNVFEEGGILEKINYMTHQLQSLDDPVVNQVIDCFNEAYYKIEEGAQLVEGMAAAIDFNPHHLDNIQSRLYELNKLKRKYGEAFYQIDLLKQTLEAKIEAIHTYQARLITAQEKMQLLKEEAIVSAYALTSFRKTQALILEDKIKNVLKTLYMPNVNFEVSFETDDVLHSMGHDRIVFLASMNQGQSLKPIHKVASGGELSRFMLALKVIFTHLSSISTIVFDEVDTGVSGKVADVIGATMDQLSKYTQVLCITHLAQVAGYADHHLHVDKIIQAGDTTTTLTYLTDEMRLTEIGKLLSGEQLSEAALLSAKELIKK